MMTLSQVKNLGRELTLFLGLFVDCFASLAGRRLLRTYVSGQMSDIQRKNCEAIAVHFDQSPRTLQRFLESIKWNEERLRDRCQEIIARDHAHLDAIGTIDESGIVKSGNETAGVARQYNGNRGKTENCINGVHLGYSHTGFHVLLDSQLYLPKDWAYDLERRKKTTFPMRSRFRQNHKLPWTWSIGL
jgi:SRSO17 transposase